MMGNGNLKRNIFFQEKRSLVDKIQTHFDKIKALARLLPLIYSYFYKFTRKVVHELTGEASVVSPGLLNDMFDQSGEYGLY